MLGQHTTWLSSSCPQWFVKENHHSLLSAVCFSVDGVVHRARKGCDTNDIMAEK